MLYLFCGTDMEKSRTKFREFLDEMRVKNPGAVEKELDEESFTPNAAEELLATRGLFQNTLLVTFRNASKNTAAAEFLEKNARAFADSENIFALYEDDSRKTALAPLEKHAKKVCRFDAAAKKKIPSSVFAFAEAFARGDRKNAWILLQKTLGDGTAPEQIFGALFWQIKTVALVKNAEKDGSVEKLGLNPFVRSKAERFARATKEEELHRLLGEIIDAYHAREDGADPEIALERLTLGSR